MVLRTVEALIEPDLVVVIDVSPERACRVRVNLAPGLRVPQRFASCRPMNRKS